MKMKLSALAALILLILACPKESVVMAANPTVEEDGMSMLLRSATPKGKQLITSDIALRLAEMVLAHVYGKEYVDAQLPLTISDVGDRWDIRGREGIPIGGGRLQIIIAKRNARILELQNFP
jgi:hypothetical protein